MAILSHLLPWKRPSSSTSCPPKKHSAYTKLSPSTPPPINKTTGNNLSRSRLEREFKWEVKDPPDHCSCGPIGDDIFQWEAVIMGPEGTPFEGGIFFLSVQVPSNYPFQPPNIKFKTKVYHPNVDEDGTIHLDILRQKQWSSPGLTLSKTLLSICSILLDPNPDDPLNPICKLYRNKKTLYDQIKSRENGLENTQWVDLNSIRSRSSFLHMACYLF